MKTCFKCGLKKPLSDFYKHRQMADGHLNKCKECTKKDAKKHRDENIDWARQYDRQRANDPKRISARLAYSKTERGKNRIKAGKLAWRERNPDKYAAHIAVRNAVRDGKLTKMPCQICGSSIRVHAHHDDYSKPLEVRWLCTTHHKEWHANQK